MLIQWKLVKQKKHTFTFLTIKLCYDFVLNFLSLERVRTPPPPLSAPPFGLIFTRIVVAFPAACQPIEYAV